MIVELPELRDRIHVFRDRSHAGEVLAGMLAPRFDRRANVVVLAIPAGGVPVAAPIAQRLALPLDLAVVSKITLPWNPEAGYGAVAFDGSVHLNERLVRELGLSEAEIEQGVARTREKVRRRDADLRAGRSYAAVKGLHAVLVDDGLASGFTLRAAIAAVRATGAAAISVAVPTAHESSADAVVEAVDAIYCPNLRGSRRFAVADAYRCWSDVDERTVAALLTPFHSPPV